MELLFTRLGFSLLVTAQVVVSAVDVSRGETTPALFNYEKIQLSDDRLGKESATFFPRGSECKIFPGDTDWPSDETWSTLNDTLNGALLKPAPMASVCYNNTAYNNFANSACEVISANWATNIER